MPVFDYAFTVRAPLARVAEFHRDTRALQRLSPPPMFVQLHRLEPLAEGSVAEFTLWLGPLPLRWRAVHSNVDPLGGFTDTNQLTENRLAAANALGLAIEHAVRFSADDANEEGLRLRIALGLLLRELIRGNTTAALDAVIDVSPTMRLALADLPKREFRNLVPVAALVDAESASVFMAPAATPEYLLYFRFSRSGKDFVPARVDFVSYQRTYEWREAGSPGLAREVGR